MGGPAAAERRSAKRNRDCGVARDQSRAPLGRRRVCSRRRHTFSVLFPPRDWPVGPKPQNNDSMVLRRELRRFVGSAGGRCGKAGGAARGRSAASHCELTQGRSSWQRQRDYAGAARRGPVRSSQSFLWDSGNSFGLPRSEILGRLANAGARVYRTDLDGASHVLPRRPLGHAFVAALQ